MEENLKGYLELMQTFLENRMTVKEFEKTFLTLRKTDPTFHGEPVFGLLQEVFNAVDTYTDLPGPSEDDEIDETELRGAVQRVHTKLETLTR